MRTLVTGASGFLGGHLTSALKAAGHETIVLARRTSDLSHVLSSIDEVRYGSLEEIDSLMEAMKGVEAVFHCAGAVRHVVPYEELLRTNVNGTRNVTRAAGKSGVERIVYASSMGAMGMRDEGNSGKKIRDRYCRSKAEAEKAFFEECERQEIEGVALRPGVIYGPRDYTAAYHWFRMAESGEIFLFGDGTSRFPLVYIDDLIEAFMRALESKDLVGRSIPIQGEDPATLEKVMRLACRELEVDFRPKRIGYSKALNLARLSELRSMLSGYRRRPPLSTFVVRLFGVDHPPAPSQAAQFGLRFPTTLEEGMMATGRWYRSLGKGEVAE